MRKFAGALALLLIMAVAVLILPVGLPTKDIVAGPAQLPDGTVRVAENRQKKGLYGIKNLSGGVWRGRFPDGTLREIREGQGIPIWNGMQVRFETGEEWSLRFRPEPGDGSVRHGSLDQTDTDQ